MSYFVTGTDTAAGKTLISCALLHAFTGKGFRAVGMKPVAAGVEADGVNEDVRQLAAASSVQVDRALANPYSFTTAIAPHIAAEQEDTRISIASIAQSYEELARHADVVIVEGVGGFCVPLNDTEDSSAMAVRLGLPVILVVGMRLGCLNHALLTMREIRRCGLECAGWVANVVDEAMPSLHENIAALQSRIDSPLLGVVKYQTVVDASAVAECLDMGLLEQRGHNRVR